MSEGSVAGVLSGHSGYMVITEAEQMEGALEQLESRLQQDFSDAKMNYNLTSEVLEDGSLCISWAGTHSSLPEPEEEPILPAPEGEFMEGM